MATYNIDPRMLLGLKAENYRIFDLETGDFLCNSLEEYCTGTERNKWYCAYEKDNFGLFNKNNSDFYENATLPNKQPCSQFKDTIEVIVTLADGTKLLKKGNIDSLHNDRGFILLHEKFN
jgi:hypothetical protein